MVMHFHVTKICSDDLLRRQSKVISLLKLVSTYPLFRLLLLFRLAKEKGGIVTFNAIAANFCRTFAFIAINLTYVVDKI